MENPLVMEGFLAGKIIYPQAMASMAISNNQMICLKNREQTILHVPMPLEPWGRLESDCIYSSQQPLHLGTDIIFQIYMIYYIYIHMLYAMTLTCFFSKSRK